MSASTPGGAQFFLNWAKERADEMDATLASLETKIDEVHISARGGARQLVENLRTARDAFLTNVGKQANAGEVAWESARSRLEIEWTRFEDQVSQYVESFGKQAKQHEAIFARQTAAQIKAWNDAADKFREAARPFSGERRSSIDATVERMKAEAVAAQARLQKVAQAGPQPWSAFNAALVETRAAFDRANQTAGNAFK